MTANLDIALPRVLTPTLDLRPVIDVGPIPGGCEPTIVGPVAAPRPPYVRAPLQLPDLDSCTEDDLADLAANAYDNESDLDVLTRSSPHVRAILGLFGRMELRADRIKAKVDELTPLLAAERHRVTREVSAHGKTVEMLTTTLLHEFRWRNKAERLEEQLNEERILRVAALQDLEDMRKVEIARGEESAAMLRDTKGSAV